MRTALILSTALVTLSLPALAQQKMAPGLWDVTMQMKSADGQVEAAMARAREEMAKMPPEQRKQMEAMMASRGMSINPAAGSTGMRICISKEQAERADVPADAEGRCKRDGMERSGNTVRFKFSCTNPPSSGSGEITTVSDKAYTMKMVMDGAAAGAGAGRPGRMEMTQQGKWLGADCGTLKPVGGK